MAGGDKVVGDYWHCMSCGKPMPKGDVQCDKCAIESTVCILIKGETMKDEKKKTGKETNKVDKEVEIPDFVSIIAYMTDAGYRVDSIRNVQKHCDQQGNTILAFTEVSIRKQGDKV